MNNDTLREHLIAQSQGQTTFNSPDALTGAFDAESAGQRFDGHPHTAWELVWHLELAGRDIYEFVTSADYQELDWPGDYWPAEPAPPTPAAWEAKLHDFRAVRQRFIDLARENDLAGVAPTGESQTVLRGILMVIEHDAYHLGQLGALRFALK